ncbi:hypothetical protein [Mycetocola saprophilus]|uniref:hypothetical protein n=1 Tax=Mycetocola saprophilus TaxID=76636 RepID=UPI003BF2B33D
MTAPAANSTVPQKKPVWKQKWFWIVVGAFLVIGTISNLVNGGSGKNDATPAPSAPVASIEPTTTASEAPVPTPEVSSPAPEVAAVSPATAEARWLEMHNVSSPTDFLSMPGYENSLANPLYAIQPGWGGSTDGFLEIKVQEQLTKESVKRLGINVLNFIGPEFHGIKGIQFTDTQGIDHLFNRGSAPLADRS